METLDKYFEDNVTNIFEKDATICKKINDFHVIKNDDGYHVIHKDYNEDYTLCVKNLKIFPEIQLDNDLGLYDFISLPEDRITMDNLRLLENKFILLEWYNEMDAINHKNCSNISCMKVHKYDDTIHYGHDFNHHPDRGIFAKKYGGNEDECDWVFITIDKLTRKQYYTWDVYNCDTDYSFKWKIWIPTPCYQELYGNM